MPQIAICGYPETEPPEPLETRTLVVRRIFDEGQVQILERDETMGDVLKRRTVKGKRYASNLDSVTLCYFRFGNAFPG